MRVLLACLLALLLAPEARADSWVPADPPEGDVAQISVSDGTAAASSQDGTSSPLSVSVRSPAGAQRPAIAVGRTVDAWHMAVAPGGWVAIAYYDSSRGAGLTVVRPDGLAGTGGSSAGPRASRLSASTRAEP